MTGEARLQDEVTRPRDEEARAENEEELLTIEKKLLEIGRKKSLKLFEIEKKELFLERRKSNSNNEKGRRAIQSTSMKTKLLSKPSHPRRRQRRKQTLRLAFAQGN